MKMGTDHFDRSENFWKFFDGFTRYGTCFNRNSRSEKKVIETIKIRIFAAGGLYA